MRVTRRQPRRGRGSNRGRWVVGGLGQLAYDKRMRVLAASQADQTAQETQELGQGVLTYVLLTDGLERRRGG